LFRRTQPAKRSLRLIRELTVELSNLYEDDGGANSFDPHKLGDRRSAFVVAGSMDMQLGAEQ
jgi:hypothetical protein